MELVLAMDLKAGLVVHGEKGNRSGYLPLTWGASPVADPVGFISHIRPFSIYIADFDRISGRGSHDAIIRECNALVSHCYADRGCRGPEDMMDLPHFENVIGTETCGRDLRSYHGGYLSIDMKNGSVIPTGDDPVDFLSSVSGLEFNGCILLDISSVGTSKGLTGTTLAGFRDAYPGSSSGEEALRRSMTFIPSGQAGLDGAIVATAVHKGIIPVDLIRERTPVLITIEGIDGCGKSSLVASLCESLADLCPVITREPGETWVGGSVRRAIAEEIDPVAEALLFVADHAVHLATVIRPALAGGKLVISDRYTDSRYAYQQVTLSGVIRTRLPGFGRFTMDGLSRPT